MSSKRSVNIDDDVEAGINRYRADQLRAGNDIDFTKALNRIARLGLGEREAGKLLRRVYDKVEREGPEMLSDDLENEIEEVLREGR